MNAVRFLSGTQLVVANRQYFFRQKLQKDRRNPITTVVHNTMLPSVQSPFARYDASRRFRVLNV